AVIFGEKLVERVFEQLLLFAVVEVHRLPFALPNRTSARKRESAQKNPSHRREETFALADIDVISVCESLRSSRFCVAVGFCFDLQPQNMLRNDIALDLVRAAVDRHLAIVEIPRREGTGVLRADALADPVVFPLL